MENLTEEVLKSRMGEPLEDRLRKDPAYVKEQKELSIILREHWEIPSRTKKQRGRGVCFLWKI